MVKTYLTIGCSEFIVHYDYRVTASGSPQTWEHPAEPFEFETTFTGLSKDEGDGKETPVDCPDWLKTEIEFWMYEDAVAYDRICMEIEQEECDRIADMMDRRDEYRLERLRDAIDRGGAEE